MLAFSFCLEIYRAFLGQGWTFIILDQEQTVIHVFLTLIYIVFSFINLSGVHSLGATYNQMIENLSYAMQSNRYCEKMQEIIRNNLYFFLSSFFRMHLQYMEVPEPRIEFKLQLRRLPQLQQCGSLTRRAMAGILNCCFLVYNLVRKISINVLKINYSKRPKLRLKN